MNWIVRMVGISVLLCLFACSSAKFEGYEETENGLCYKFYSQSADSAKPKVGDYIFVQMINKFSEDSVLFSSWDAKDDGVVSFQLRQPAFKGSIEEAIMLMSKGDSASFKISADSIYALIPKEDSAKAFPPGTYFTFEIKLMNVMTAMEMQEKQQKKYEAYLAEIESKSKWNKENEQKIIQEYLTQSKITTAPSQTGLFYIEHEPGKGKKAVKGSTVVVNYVGRTLLDGQVFDASEMHGRPYEFVLGKDPVISGWVEGLERMKAGGKATFLIPSALAYDSTGSIDPQSGMYAILPYSPLLFEIELVEVK